MRGTSTSRRLSRFIPSMTAIALWPRWCGAPAVIARVRGGGREAFRELVGRYSEMVFRLAYRFAGNQDGADDIVQEAFLRAYRGLQKFEGSASCSTWLYRIATNCALDML